MTRDELHQKACEQSITYIMISGFLHAMSGGLIVVAALVLAIGESFGTVKLTTLGLLIVGVLLLSLAAYGFKGVQWL